MPLTTKSPQRSNAERTGSTRAALLDAALALFVERGYGATSTPDICAAAGMTRGALYHHFTDKQDLFRAVVTREAQAVALAIVEATSGGDLPARDALLNGVTAYLDAMQVGGRTRLLLIEAPAALGRAEADALDASFAGVTLHDGLVAALRRDRRFTTALAALLSAAFDRAALDIELGAHPQATRKAMRWLIERVVATDSLA